MNVIVTSERLLITFPRHPRHFLSPWRYDFAEGSSLSGEMIAAFSSQLLPPWRNEMFPEMDDVVGFRTIENVKSAIGDNL